MKREGKRGRKRRGRGGGKRRIEGGGISVRRGKGRKLLKRICRARAVSRKQRPRNGSRHRKTRDAKKSHDRSLRYCVSKVGRNLAIIHSAKLRTGKRIAGGSRSCLARRES